MIPQPSAAVIAGALEARPAGRNRWRACCPAHDDRDPSLAITERDGRVLLKCWSGCPQDAVIDALRARGLWRARRESAPRELDDLERIARLHAIRRHENKLRRGLVLTDAERRHYRSSQALVYAPYSAAEVAGMHLFAVVYESAVRAGAEPTAAQTARYCDNAPRLLGRPMPYDY